MLIRHAATKGGSGRAIGRTPLALSDEGERQAHNLAFRLHNVEFGAIYSSPASRALETLTPLTERTGQVPLVMPELDEIDLGAWDGLSFETIRTQYPQAYEARGRALSSYRSPQGESFEDVAERVSRALATIAAGPQPALVMTHAGCIRTVLCRCTQTPLDDMMSFSPPHAAPYIFTVENGTMRLVDHNLEHVIDCDYLI